MSYQMVEPAEMMGECAGDGTYPPADRALWAPSQGWAAVTVEHALYVAIFCLGVAVRFWGLARMPLNALEATTSWAAWQQAMPHLAAVDGPAVLAPASPLYHHLLTLIFWLGAGGDAAARVFSVAAGSALVLMPWLLRNVLGRQAALVLSFLIALDPWLVAFSRLADGAMLSTTLAMAVLALLAGAAYAGAGGRDSEKGAERTASTLIALCGGLLLTSGPATWSFLPVIAVFVAFNYASLRHALVVDGVTLAWFAGAFLAGATGWLSRPAGVGLVSASLTTWVDTVLLAGPAGLSTGNAYGGLWPLRTLLVDQPLIALFGIGGIIHMTWRRQTSAYTAVHWRELLWSWLAWGAILCLVPGRSPFSLLVLVMPLLFGSAYSLSVMLAALPVGENGRETIAVAGTLLLLLVSAGYWGAALASSPALDMAALQALFLVLLLGAAILVVYGVWSDRRTVLWSGVAVVGLALLLANVGSTWRLNHRYDLGRLGGLFAEAGDLGARRLAQDVQTISAQRAGDAFTMPVVVEKGDGLPSGAPGYFGRIAGAGAENALADRDTILAWYLRDMQNVQWGTRTELNDLGEALVISEEDDEASSFLSGKDDAEASPPYAGSRYRILSTVPVGPAPPGGSRGEGVADAAAQDIELQERLRRLWSERVQAELRWAFYREGQAAPLVESVTLWAPRPE